MVERGLELVEKMLGGDRLALARLITLVENRSPLVGEIMRRVYPRVGRSHVVGFTGPPGGGKSTLVDRLTAHIRAAGESVGIIAVDPSSPFSGGAVLGDRIRMQQHALDAGVFIRSMATRGSLGGLSRATAEVVRLLDAFGKEWVLIETVGVGQTELDIIKMADTTVVILVPESGDAIQTMKAGLMEVADIFCVNKADREGGQPLITELRFSVHIHRQTMEASKDLDWEIPVLATQAHQDVGIAELLAELRRHRQLLAESGILERRRQAKRRAEFQEVIIQGVRQQITQALTADGALAAYVEKVTSGALDPYTAASEILHHTDLWLKRP